MMVAVIGMAVANICIILYCAALRKELNDVEDRVNSVSNALTEFSGTVTDMFIKQREITSTLLEMVEYINGRR